MWSLSWEFNWLALKQPQFNWLGQLAQDILPVILRKAKYVGPLAELIEKLHAARPLGTSGIRFSAHCAFPTREEQ